MSQQNNWQSHDDDRIIKKIANNIHVIKPKIMNDYIPLFCPVCKVVMDMSFDAYTYSIFECCEPCANEWAYPNTAKWKKAWRPNQSAIVLHVSKRNKRSLGLNVK